MNSSPNRKLSRNGHWAAAAAAAALARADTDAGREFDAAVARKLGEIEPPAGLRDALLAHAATAALAKRAAGVPDEA